MAQRPKSTSQSIPRRFSSRFSHMCLVFGVRSSWAVLFLIVRPPLAVSIIILVLVEFFFLPLGILLRWLAAGVIQRKRVRIVISTIVLVFLSFALGFGSLLAKRAQVQSPFEQLEIGISLVIAAAVVTLGLFKRSEVL